MLIEIPLRLQSEARLTGHWRAKNARKKNHYQLVGLYFNLNKITAIEPPFKVVLTRVAPRLLDDDNLVYAFKFIRDAVADRLIPGKAPGRADSEMYFEYKQEKRSKIYLVKIEIIK